MVGPVISSEAVTALRAYQQADEEGVMVLVSRQALEEALAFFDGLAQGCAMFGCQQREWPSVTHPTTPSQ